MSRQFIATHFADDLSVDERRNLKAEYAREGYTYIIVKSRALANGERAFEFWGLQGGLCSSCNSPLMGFVSANNDTANDLQFCQACTRLSEDQI